MKKLVEDIITIKEKIYQSFDQTLISLDEL